MHVQCSCHIHFLTIIQSSTVTIYTHGVGQDLLASAHGKVDGRRGKAETTWASPRSTMDLSQKLMRKALFTTILSRLISPITSKNYCIGLEIRSSVDMSSTNLAGDRPKHPSGIERNERQT